MLVDTRLRTFPALEIEIEWILRKARWAAGSNFQYAFFDNLGRFVDVDGEFVIHWETLSAYEFQLPLFKIIIIHILFLCKPSVENFKVSRVSHNEP